MGLGEFVELDLTIVRGLAYYTGTVFELFDAGRTLRAICGGGRYDELLEALGGVDLPALGFGMGDVVLGELLKERGLAPGADVRARRLSGRDHRGRSRRRCWRWRTSCATPGSRTSTPSAPQAVGKQLKLADARARASPSSSGRTTAPAARCMLKDLRQGPGVGAPGPRRRAVVPKGAAR